MLYLSIYLSVCLSILSILIYSYLFLSILIYSILMLSYTCIMWNTFDAWRIQRHAWWVEIPDKETRHIWKPIDSATWSLLQASANHSSSNQIRWWRLYWLRCVKWELMAWWFLLHGFPWRNLPGMILDPLPNGSISVGSSQQNEEKNASCLDDKEDILVIRKSTYWSISWTIIGYMRLSINGGTPFIMGNPIKMDDLGVPLFQETSISFS